MEALLFPFDNVSRLEKRLIWLERDEEEKLHPKLCRVVEEVN
jgi:hypothetical protein